MVRGQRNIRISWKIIHPYLMASLITWSGVSLCLTATVYFCFSQLGDS